ncbi:MAG: STAS domain-containing protein [Phycisphaerae bacterium]|jgi:anti-anti-sigma regulatory factor
MSISNYSQGIIIVELPSEPHIRGELDTLMEVLRCGADTDVIINFEKVDIMTSLTLSGFLKVREIVVNAGKRLIFINVPSITKDIFKVTCFDGIFEFAADKEQALVQLKSQQCEHSDELFQELSK